MTQKTPIRRFTLIALLCLSLPLVGAKCPGGGAGAVAPAAYSIENGDEGNSAYFDASYDGIGAVEVARAPLHAGLGELTDGIIAEESWRASPEPYVGWRDTDPQMRFTFCDEVELRAVVLHMDAPVDDDGGVSAPSMVEVRVGDSLVSHTVESDQSGPTAIRIPLGDRRGSSVEIALSQRTRWMMLSEVEFRGWRRARDADDPLAGQACAVPGDGWLPLDNGAVRGRYEVVIDDQSVNFNGDTRMGLAEFEEFQVTMDDTADMLESLGISVDAFVPYLMLHSTFTGPAWPGAYVPYEVHSDFSPAEVDEIERSIGAWEAGTLVSFGSCSSAAGASDPCPELYLSIEPANGRCSTPGASCATVGAVPGADVLINEASFEGADVNDTIVHELGHALGLRHEHQRPDGASLIRIHCENLENPAGCDGGNFSLLPEGSVRLFGDYDYHSVMHYRRSLGGSDLVLEPLILLPNGTPDRDAWVLGSRSTEPGPSKVDFAGVNAQYLTDVAGSFYQYGEAKYWELANQITNHHHARSLRWGWNDDDDPNAVEPGVAQETHVIDMDGDGLDDLVLFMGGTGGEVYVSLSKPGCNGDDVSLPDASTGDRPTRFCNPEKWLEGFCLSGDTCGVGDFDRDGVGDLIALAEDGAVWVADSERRFLCAFTPGGCRFDDVRVWHTQLASIGWANGGHAIADVDADGRDDVVVFQHLPLGAGNGYVLNVRVARSDGTRFGDGSGVPDFWTQLANASEPLVGDLTGDSRADLVEIVAGDVRVHHSTGETFFSGGLWGAGFCTTGYCRLGDMDGDEILDLVNFAGPDYCSRFASEPHPADPEQSRGCAHHPLTRVRIALSSGNTFDPEVEFPAMGGSVGWTRTTHEMDCRATWADGSPAPCLVGDVDGDGRADMIDPVYAWTSDPGLGREAGDVYVSMNTGVWRPCVPKPGGLCPSSFPLP